MANRPPHFPLANANLLTDLKARVCAAQLRAAVSVNHELILLYWDIGKIIAEAQKTKGYGKQVVERLAEDLQKEFLGTTFFSSQKSGSFSNKPAESGTPSTASGESMPAAGRTIMGRNTSTLMHPQPS